MRTLSPVSNSDTPHYDLMPDQTSNNTRIAKNTIILYLRTIVLMLITLYTSRVILEQLGVDDYGIYNVVGGVVAMFSVISSALTSSISRFITFELGRGDIRRLSTVFSTSVNIQIGLCVIVLIIGEAVLVPFLNAKMNIPPDRIIAANWVLQCSILTFCINLISVPYNACIIAHEKMSAFAYIGIIEAVLKLLICYMFIVSQIDRLIMYSLLMLSVALLIRLIYGFYCSRHFEECKYHLVNDKAMIKEMTGFAGWSFFPNIAWVFNTQGVTILINIFFGVALNAARAIAFQVESAVMVFVRNFTTALNPQITKYYASGDKEQMFLLMCRGAKFTYFLTLIMALPILLETGFILNLWLKEVPPHTVIFVQLSIIGSVINNIGITCYTACQATGNIKRFSLIVTSVGVLVFPMTWLAFRLGMPAESAYIIYILVYICVSISCMLVTRWLLRFPISMFFHRALLPMIWTTILSLILPAYLCYSMESSLARFIVICAASFASSCIVIYMVGLSKGEKTLVCNKVMSKFKTV